LSFKVLERVSPNTFRFLREKHARQVQEAVAQRWLAEQYQELEAVRTSEILKHDRASIAELELAATWSALDSEQLALGTERAARALAEELA